MIDRAALLAPGRGDTALVSALGAALPGLRKVADGWRLPGPKGRARPVVVRRDGDWLTLAMTAPSNTDSRGDDPRRLLRLNHDLPAGVRLAREPGRSRPRLLAEVQIVHERVRISALRQAHAALLAASRRIAAPVEEAGRGPADPLAPEMVERVREAGWPVEVRADGSVAVPFAPASRSAPALAAVVRGAADGGLVVEVELARFPTAAAIEHRALARFLLGVNTRIRVARAAAVARDRDEEAVCLEVRFEQPPEPDVLAAAFAACAAAGRLAAAEARCLCHERVARVFLAIRSARAGNHEGGS